MKKYTKDFPRYSGMNLYSENYMDLHKSIKGDALVGIIDEEQGGIIAYVLRGNEMRVINALNDQQRQKQTERFSQRDAHKYTAPSLAEIRTWTDEELTDLRWVHDMHRKAKAGGETAMMRKRKAETILKRAHIVREERKSKNQSA